MGNLTKEEMVTTPSAEADGFSEDACDGRPTMKIYLAARYSRREELCGYAADLRAAGHVVTSRWLDGNHQIDDQGLSVEAKAAERTRFACEDWEDLMAADLVISFTEAPRSSNSRGGRHVEFGAALAANKAVVVIGHRENVFHHMPTVRFHPTWEAFRGRTSIAEPA